MIKTAADTRSRIIDAALETLKREGFAGTSSRVVARTGDFNQALIFYHFGSLHGLLLAALDHTSEQRMARYRAAVEGATTLEELVEVASNVYREDLATGHITVVSELIAGSLAHPELGPQVVARMDPWIAFTEEVIANAMRDSPIAAMIPARHAARALVAFYLGVNLLTHIDRDEGHVDALFELARALAPVVSPMTEP